MNLESNLNIAERTEEFTDDRSDEITSEKYSSNLKFLNNTQLHIKLGELVQRERSLSKIVITTIAEVDARKLYLSMAYPSLFEYLVRAHGYSPSSAQRRIDAARLLQKVPEIADKIEQGSLSLNQISKLQQGLREVRKIEKHVEPQAVDKTLLVKKLITQIESKSQKETELIIASELQLPTIQVEKTKTQKDRSIRLEITLTEEQFQLLQEAKDCLSHSLARGAKAGATGSWAEVITYMSRKVIQMKRGKAAGQHSRSVDSCRTNTSAAALDVVSVDNKQNLLEAKRPRPLSTAKRKIILKQDQCCQYRDPVTGRKCESKKFLEVDHVHPQWDNGSNDLNNLRVLCSAHNKFRYVNGI